MDKEIKETRNNTNPTDETIKWLQREFSSTAGLIAPRLGLNPTVGQIYALLYLSPDPVSLDDMVEKLNISKASASLNIRYLESRGAVKRVWVNGTRKDYYESEPDIVKIVISRLKYHFKEIDDRFKILETELNQKTQQTKSINKDQQFNFYSDRFKRIKKMYDNLTKLLKILPVKSLGE